MENKYSIAKYQQEDGSRPPDTAPAYALMFDGKVVYSMTENQLLDDYVDSLNKVKEQ